MIVTVASFKGGQAKTTTAVHLAALLNEQSPALLVDGDPISNARFALGSFTSSKEVFGASESSEK